MASVGITLPTGLGDLQIYINPPQKAKADKLLKEMPELLTQAYLLAAQRFGERLARMAKSCLAHGLPPSGSGVSWPPHTAATTKRLGAHTLLYWSTQYYHAIRVSKRGRNIYVGVPAGLKKTRPDGYKGTNRLTLVQVAKILEYGGGNVPARPLWNPLWAVMKDKFSNELVQEIRKQVRKYM